MQCAQHDDNYRRPVTGEKEKHIIGNADELWEGEGRTATTTKNENLMQRNYNDGLDTINVAGDWPVISSTAKSM